eukprot:2062746-Rhodomonas_salina.1
MSAATKSVAYARLASRAAAYAPYDYAPTNVPTVPTPYVGRQSPDKFMPLSVTGSAYDRNGFGHSTSPLKDAKELVPRALLSSYAWSGTDVGHGATRWTRCWY